MNKLWIPALVTAALALACSSQSDDSLKAASSSSGVPSSPGATPVNITGKVAETMDSGGYTYVLIDTGSEQVWAATPEVSVAVGDEVRADQEIIEVETNKAVMGVTTLCNGTVSEIRAAEGVSYSVGSLLGMLEVTQEEVERTGVDTLESLEANNQSQPQTDNNGDNENLHFAIDGDSYEEDQSIIPSVKGLPVPTGVMGAHYISPRMRARMNDMGLREADISAIAGTGAGGRVTVEDLERFLDYLEAWPSAP